MFINGENVVVVNNDDSPNDDVEYCVGEYKESWYEVMETASANMAVRRRHNCNTKTLYSQNVCVSDDPILFKLS
jgi:hypothetical protein